MLFPELFSKGRFGYHYTRNINIHMSRYFNQKLLNHTQQFSSNSDYIFYAQLVLLLQEMNFHRQISIVMGKMSSLGLNASMFQNYKESVQWFVRNNQGFTFINQIRGTPVYLKKFQSEVLAMVKQLGCLSFLLFHV